MQLAIRATWTNGQIVPAEAVDWPEGSQLMVEPVRTCDEKIGITEDEWRDDAAAIADWEAWIGTIEPMIWAEGEREEYEQYREKFRQFNIKAVAGQMEQFNGDVTK
jgi:hypothetical protein